MQILGDAKNMFRRGNPFLKREVCSNAQAGVIEDWVELEPKPESVARREQIHPPR